MKLLIASDLHGSARYCRALLETFRREQADRLVLLGDLLYHGPPDPLPEEYDTQAVTAMLNTLAEHILCVRGNCDSEVDQMVLSFPVLADYAYLSAAGADLFATHGHLYGPEQLPPLRARGASALRPHPPAGAAADRPRSPISIPAPWPCPKEGTPHSCMTLENGVFTWLDVVTGQPFQPLG